MEFHANFNSLLLFFFTEWALQRYSSAGQVLCRSHVCCDIRFCDITEILWSYEAEEDNAYSWWEMIQWQSGRDWERERERECVWGKDWGRFWDRNWGRFWDRDRDRDLDKDWEIEIEEDIEVIFKIDVETVAETEVEADLEMGNEIEIKAEI